MEDNAQGVNVRAAINFRGTEDLFGRNVLMFSQRDANPRKGRLGISEFRETEIQKADRAVCKHHDILR